MWSMKATASRSTDPAATGRRSRSTIVTAAWSAIPASRRRSAPATDRSSVDSKHDIQPGERASIAGFSFGQLDRCRMGFAALSGAVQIAWTHPRCSIHPTCTESPTVLLLHVIEHGRGRPAIDLEAVGLLVGAERRAREHAGFAVDLVLVEPDLGQRTLHRLDLAGAQLRALAPWGLERTRIDHAVCEVADEQHVEIREIVFLDHVVVLEREERRAVGALRLQQRGGFGLLV